MKTPVKTFAIALAVLAMGTLGLTAGESSRKPSPSSSAKAVHGVNGTHQAVVESRLKRQRSLIWNPCVCGPTPISVYRYGNPVAPISNAFYGLPSFHQANFFQNYPIHRGR